MILFGGDKRAFWYLIMGWLRGVDRFVFSRVTAWVLSAMSCVIMTCFDSNSSESIGRHLFTVDSMNRGFS